MAKRSRRRPAQCDKNRLGCMWSFIHIFDFRLGRLTRRLLSDRRHGIIKRDADARYSQNKLKLLTGFDEKYQGIDFQDGDPSKTLKVNNSKTSVKKLMEDDMSCERHPETQLSSAAVEQMQSDLESQESYNPYLMEQSSHNSNLTSLMEEFCSQIHLCQEIHRAHEDEGDSSDVQCSISSAKNSQLDELDISMVQKFIDVKQLTRDGAIHQSNQLTDALEILDSNKELFLKLLQDHNSLLTKHFCDLHNARAKEIKPTDSLAVVRQGEELVCRKQFQKQNFHNFFRRKVKSRDGNLSKESGDPPVLSRIVVLKPVSVQSSSSIEPCNSLRNQGQSRRVDSRFSFKEIKNKLKNAIVEGRKERHLISMDGIPQKFPHECQGLGNGGKGIIGETVGKDLPNKTYFNAETIAKPRNCQPIVGNLTMKMDGYPKQKESDIYIEARKHLAEILSTEEEDKDSSSTQSPITLRRIMSFPEYKSSPIFGPGKDREHNIVIAQKMFSPDNIFKQENNVELSPLSQNFETPVFIDGNNSEIKQVNDSNPDTSKELLERECSVREDPSPKGGMEIVEITDIDTNHSDMSSEIIPTTPGTSSNQSADTKKIYEEEGSLESSRLESLKESQQPSSSLDSFPSSSLPIHKVKSLGDEPEWSSPVSVLEPFFLEDVTISASTISQSAELPMQPLHIPFEELDSSTLMVTPPSSREIYIRTCLEDKRSTFEYVRAVLQASSFSWDDFLGNYHSSNQLLDPSFFDEVEISLTPNQHCGDPKLLFDCIGEVLLEVYDRYFGWSPWVSFVKPNIRPVPVGNNLLSEVWKGVDWHLFPHFPPHTLDQIIGKDLSKSGTWMDLRFNSEAIGIEMGEIILDELMEEIVFDYPNTGY